MLKRFLAFIKSKNLVNHVKKLILPLIIFTYFISMLKAWWPGQMSKDSLDQYLMALKISPMADWHPPVMSLLWRTLNSFFTSPSPATLFVFHLLLYLLGIYLCITYISKNYLVQVFLFIIFSAFVSSQQIVIWKDTGMVGSLLVAIGAGLILSKTKKKQSRKALFLLSFSSLLYATSIRWNAFPAITVVSLLTIYSYFQKKINLKVISTAILFLGSLFLISIFLNYSIVEVKKTYPIQNILVYDLVGILYQSPVKNQEENLQLIPDYWQTNENQLDWKDIQTSKKLYSPISVGNLIFGGNVPLTENKQNVSVLKTSWKKAVLLNPSAYFRHRQQVFNKFINLELAPPYYPYNDWVNGNDLGISSNSNRLTHISRLWYKNMPNIFYYPWFWLVISLAEITTVMYLIISKKIRIKNTVNFFLVCLSGLSYLVLLFFIIPSADFRYAYYLTVTTILSAFLLIKEMLEKRK